MNPLSLDTVKPFDASSLMAPKHFRFSRKRAKKTLQMNNFTESSFNFSSRNLIFYRLFLGVYLRYKKIDT